MESRKRKGTKHIPVDSNIVEIREDLAKCMHDYWRRLMEYIIDLSVNHDDGSVEIDHFDASRIRRRMKTSFDGSHKADQEMYRAEADRILTILRHHEVLK